MDACAVFCQLAAAITDLMPVLAVIAATDERALDMLLADKG